jgi:hypothetical protein
VISRKTYITQHSKLGVTPKPWHWIFLAPVFIPRRANFIFWVKKSRNFLRQFRAVSLSEDLTLGVDSLPQIEILSVAAGKDLEFLGFALKNAIKHSKNEVVKISVICPKNDLKLCQELMSSENFKCEVVLVDEEKQIDESIRIQLKQRFKDRYGWVLQQLLAVNFVLNSNAKGILLLNADTVMLREVQWLDFESNQILMASVEYHEPYYVFLHKTLRFAPDPRYTFITHHMLFQPPIYRSILEKKDITSIELLARLLIEESDPNEDSPFCIEFEPYAQGMLEYFLRYVRLRKFSNLSILRTKENISNIHRVIDNNLRSDYNSVSFHDYLTNDRS